MPMEFAIAAAVLFGVVVGFVNGFLSVHQKTEPFIITLGMGLLLTGVAQQLTDAHPVPARNPAFMMIGNGDFHGVPNLVIITVVCFALAFWLMRYTQFGRNLYAIGGDYEVARYSGIPVVRTKWIAFVISGGCRRPGGDASLFQAQHGLVHLRGPDRARGELRRRCRGDLLCGRYRRNPAVRPRPARVRHAR